MPRIIAWASLFSAFFACQSSSKYVINQRTWDFRGHNISYDEAFRIGNDKPADSKIGNHLILLLNGFGVGTFHQHRLVANLLVDENRELKTTVYCVDYLGQGRSWPIDCNDGLSKNESGLIYSGDTWLDQIIQFIEQVIKPTHSQSTNTRVHIIGNSVGGHLAVFLAACRPDLVETICLLNATPFWGLNLPGWSGHLPAPRIPKWIGHYLFDQIRKLRTLKLLLKLTYVNHDAYGEKLALQMRECCEGKGGHAAFASMLWSPPVTAFQENPLSFYDCLSSIDCDVLLVFGKDDPLCRRAFAKKMLRKLSTRQRHHSSTSTVHRYVELSSVGHCPNHEAPHAVAQLISLWTKANNRCKDNLSLVKGKEQTVKETWGETIMKEQLETDIEVGVIDRLAMAFG